MINFATIKAIQNKWLRTLIYIYLYGCNREKRDGSQELLVKMQLRYNLQVARSKKENITRWENLKKHCAAML